MDDLVYSIRSMIMALPGRLAMDVTQAANANEASAIIRAECSKILNELAGYKYDPEEYQRRVRDRQGWSEALADEAARAKIKISFFAPNGEKAVKTIECPLVDLLTAAKPLVFSAAW